MDQPEETRLLGANNTQRHQSSTGLETYLAQLTRSDTTYAHVRHELARPCHVPASKGTHRSSETPGWNHIFEHHLEGGEVSSSKRFRTPTGTS